MTEYLIHHPSGLIFPVEVHPPQEPITPGNLPPDWPGILSDPEERAAADGHLQGMYRALSFHTVGGCDIRKRTVFRQFAGYMLGEWCFNGEESC